MAEENRDSFFKRLDPFMAPSAMLGVQLAYTLAKYGHRGQFRKEVDATGHRIRYFEHVRRVAIVLIDELEIVRQEMVVASLLHDIIEDAPNLPAAVIEHAFGTDVTTIVKVLSKDPKEGYLKRFRACTDWRPYVIKGCDRLDNLRSLSVGDEGFRMKQVAETHDKYYPLFDRMVEITPDIYRNSAVLLRQMLHEETERQALLIQQRA